MSRLRPRDDSGAYAILYGILMLTVLGMAALVVDLGAIRQNRRQTRLAADAAAVAGARQLDTYNRTANPFAACTDAWSYVGTNLGFNAASAATGCGVFPTTVSACPTTPVDATGTVGRFTVTITWPVLDSSTLLTQPNVRPAGTSAAQAIDPAFDGTDACARIAVSVRADEDPAFAGIFGVGTTETLVTTVARSSNELGPDGPIAALNVLHQTDCHAILTGGQAAIEVLAVEDRPGIIAVESSGRHQGGARCPQSIRYVIDVAEASAGGYVRANGPGGVGQGTILSYALNAAPTGNPADAFNPATVPPGSSLLTPRPTVMAQRFGATPITDIYNCTGACRNPHTAYVNTLRSRLGSGTPQPYANAAPPYNGLAFRTVSAATVPNWPGCTIGVKEAVLVPAGNWFVDCPTLTVRGVLVFAGGTVVTRGGIDVASGCFAMNVPLVGIASCPTLNTLGQVVPPATTEGILYLRGGNFSKGSQAALFTERTFVHMSSGNISFGGGDIGALYMTNPAPDPATCTSTCANARFGKLSLWNESTSTQSMGGQSGVTLRGVLFTPNALFSYAGQGAQVQTSAQFWASRIHMSGQGLLRMAPDPKHSVQRPELSTVLIR